MSSRSLSMTPPNSGTFRALAARDRALEHWGQRVGVGVGGLAPERVGQRGGEHGPFVGDRAYETGRPPVVENQLQLLLALGGGQVEGNAGVEERELQLVSS